MAEDPWNMREPEPVALAYTPDSRWRNRAEIFSGLKAITAFSEVEHLFHWPLGIKLVELPGLSAL